MRFFTSLVLERRGLLAVARRLSFLFFSICAVPCTIEGRERLEERDRESVRKYFSISSR